MTDLPEAVLALLRESVDSFDKLEILLRVRRDPDRTWSAIQIAQELHVPEISAERALGGLGEAGLVEAVVENGRQTFRFAPPSSSSISAVDALAAACEERRIEVVSFLSQIAIDRIRGTAARALADAFHFRKDPKGTKDG